MLKVALLMIAAAGLSAPSGSMDIVRHLLRSLPDVNKTGQAAGADVDLWIAPDGIIQDCTVPRQTGDEDLVRLICPAFQGYRMNSPKGADGSSAYADISLPITLFPERNPSLRNRLDAGLEQLRKGSGDQRYVQREGLRWRAGWRVVVEVDEDGAVKSCARANRDVRKASAEQVCAAVSDTIFAQRVGPDGNPVRYVKTVEALP